MKTRNLKRDYYLTVVTIDRNGDAIDAVEEFDGDQAVKALNAIETDPGQYDWPNSNLNAAVALAVRVHMTDDCTFDYRVVATSGNAAALNAGEWVPNTAWIDFLLRAHPTRPTIVSVGPWSETGEVVASSRRGSTRSKWYDERYLLDDHGNVYVERGVKDRARNSIVEIDPSDPDYDRAREFLRNI